MNSGEELREQLELEARALGGQKAWAKRHRLSTAYVNDLVHGRKEITSRVARMLGYERRVVFVPRNGK